MRSPERIPTPTRVRHGDTVKIMTGRDRGKTGKVLTVNAVTRMVTVERVNMIKRHTRPNPSKNIAGGILEKEGPIHISNVMLLCPGCEKHARVGMAALPDGTRGRICRRCGTTLER
jgi:large subunit ribosomal protein L24